MYSDKLQKHFAQFGWITQSSLHTSDTDRKVTRWIPQCDPRAYCMKETKNIYERPVTEKSELERHCQAPHWRISDHEFNNSSWGVVCQPPKCVTFRQSSRHRPNSITIASGVLKICHENLNFVIIGQQYRTFYMKTWVCFWRHRFPIKALLCNTLFLYCWQRCVVQQYTESALFLVHCNSGYVSTTQR